MWGTYGLEVSSTLTCTNHIADRFDFSRGQAFKTNDFSSQAKMMDAMITGLERSLIGFT